MTFKEYILHQLREMKRELITALDGVEDDDLYSFEPVGHWPIGWIAEHCTQVADFFLIRPVQGSDLHRYEVQIANWTEREPQPGDTYPDRAQIVERWAHACDEIIGFVEQSDEQALQGAPGNEPYVHSILRVINHTNSHLRSLWCILGERRVDAKWAVQQPFLA